MDKKNNKMIVLISVLVIAVLTVVIVAANSGKAASAKPVAKATYTAKVTSTNVNDPATLQVTYDVTNTGNAAGYPECTVSAKNASGSYSGFSTISSTKYLTAPMKPGETTTLAQDVTVTNQGAQYADQVTVTCK